MVVLRNIVRGKKVTMIAFMVSMLCGGRRGDNAGGKAGEKLSTN